VRRRGRSRIRTALLSAAGALALVALVPFGPHVLALARGAHHSRRPAASDTQAPPDDWGREGTFLDAAHAYPAVVRVVNGSGSPFCSGSVVRSPGGDIVVTAAHCVYAGGSYTAGLSVVPGATGGDRPFGAWHVDRIWVDPHYTGGHDERYDYAFLRVSRSDGRRIQDATGADTLRVGQPFHLRDVTTTGYPDSGDPGGRQLTCRLQTYRSATHPHYREMHCGGYTAGVSGSPWVLLAPGARTGDLVGVIGGFNGGGPPDDDPHVDAISYSPYFDDATRTLLDRAESGDGGWGGGS
jgi:Trypsin